MVLQFRVDMCLAVLKDVLDMLRIRRNGAIQFIYTYKTNKLNTYSNKAMFI